MFLSNSRYHKVAVVQTVTSTGENVTAIALRALGSPESEPRMVEGGDRLDLIGHERTGEGTRFWHVADANTALDGRTLVDTPGDVMAAPKG